MLSVGILSAFKIKHFNPATGWQGTDATVGAHLWNTGAGLAPIIVQDGVLAPAAGVNVSQAMAIPPVARAIMLYASVMAGSPLTAKQDGQPHDLPWLTHTDGALTPAVRNVQMMQDIFFAGHSCLQVIRNEAGHVTDAIRLPLDRWSLDAEGYVLMDGQLEPQDRFVYIPGFLPMGFLTYAASTIRSYEAMVRTVESRSANPVPLIAIHIEEDCTLEDDEIEEVITNWSNARKSKNGAVAVVPRGIRLEVLGEGADDGAMLTAGRDAARLDVANFVNMTAALVDGNNGTSGTYENTLQNQNEFSALSLPLFTLPIALRLSQDDVTPPGVSVSFDTSALDAAPADARGNVGAAVAPSPNNQEITE